MATRRRQLAEDPFADPEEAFAPTDEVLFGKLGQVDKGREVIREIELDKIWPDLQQPRRLVPHSVRGEWDGNPAQAGLVLAAWYQAAKQKAGQDLPMRAWLEGQEVNEAEWIHPLIVELKGLAGLASSLRRDGQQNAITIWASGRDTYILHTGERRWLASWLLKAYFAMPETIKARIIDKPSVWSQAAENGRRQALNAIGMARQLALLVMDMYPGEFDAYADMVLPGECERKFYAQVADGNRWRVAAGMAGQVAEVMGLSSGNQIPQYRRLLGLPDEIWLQADEENWTEGRCREFFKDAEGTKGSRSTDSKNEDGDTLTTVRVPQRQLRKPGLTPSWQREQLTAGEEAILRFMTEAEFSPREALKPVSARASLAVKKLIERVGDEYRLTDKAAEYGYKWEPGEEEAVPAPVPEQVHEHHDVAIGLSDDERAMLQFMVESGQDNWSPGELPQPRGIRGSLLRKGLIEQTNGFYRLSALANEMGYQVTVEDETLTTVRVPESDDAAATEEEGHDLERALRRFEQSYESRRYGETGRFVGPAKVFPTNYGEDADLRRALAELGRQGLVEVNESGNAYRPVGAGKVAAADEDIRTRILREMPMFEGPWEAVLKGLLRLANVAVGQAEVVNSLGEVIGLTQDKLQGWVEGEGAEQVENWMSEVYLDIVGFFGTALQERFERALEMAYALENPGGGDVQEG